MQYKHTIDIKGVQYAIQNIHYTLKGTACNAKHTMYINRVQYAIQTYNIH